MAYLRVSSPFGPAANGNSTLSHAAAAQAKHKIREFCVLLQPRVADRGKSAS
jgi:hypothetical protein